MNGFFLTSCVSAFVTRNPEVPFSQTQTLFQVLGAQDIAFDDDKLAPQLPRIYTWNSLAKKLNRSMLSSYTLVPDSPRV